MRQELIDLLLGELEPAEADALKARLHAEPELRRELADLESLFGLMRRSAEVEPSPGIREAVVAAATRVRPSPLVRLRALPGLVAYRFRSSFRFRVATISLCAHIVVIAVLAQILLAPGDESLQAPPELVASEAPAEPVEPERSFVMRLSQRRVWQSSRLRQYGVAGQEEHVAAGLETLLKTQRPDGSFGDAAETGYAAMAFLAQGDCSAQRTPRGRAIRLACARILADARRGEVHGAMLAALVEDYSLAYPILDAMERMDYQVAIRKLILGVPDDDISREALLLASLAGFTIPSDRLGEAQLALSGDRVPLLGLEPTRLRATVVLARGRSSLDPEQVRAWAAPLFERAVSDLRAGRGSALVLVTLQSPYRL